MVPVEVTAFTLLAVCVLLLAGVQFFQLFPRGDATSSRPLMLVFPVVVVVLSIVVIIQTHQ